MADDLVERLRQHRIILKSGDYDGAQLMEAWCDMINAATRIEFDSKRIEELEGALRPFAREFDRMRWDESKDCLSFGDSGFCYGDLREASATLADELHVPPKRRITIPEGHRALIVSEKLRDELWNLCIMLRKQKRIAPEDREGVRGIAGDLLLAIAETDQ